MDVNKLVPTPAITHFHPISIIVIKNADIWVGMHNNPAAASAVICTLTGNAVVAYWRIASHVFGNAYPAADVIDSQIVVAINVPAIFIVFVLILIKN